MTMSRGRSRPMPKGHGNGPRTVHWVVDEGALCGRTPERGLVATEDQVTCRWCLHRAANPIRVHRSKRVCVECGADWPCVDASQPAGSVRDGYLREVGLLMMAAGTSEHAE